MAKEQGTCSVFKSSVNNDSNLTSTSLPAFNETIQFGGNSKTYKELVYTSSVRKTLNHPIKILTNDSTTSRLADRNRKKGTKVIPRPQNAWIIYRRDKTPEFKGMLSSEASIKIGKRWRNESKEVLEYFVALSMLALENHQKKYGNYKFQPKQKISKMYKKSKNRQSKSKENVENISPIFPAEEMTLNQNLPQLTVIPSSPINECLPTPASSIQHSPLTFQGELSDQYLPTPASSTPLTFQGELLDQYLSTPASSIQHSPLTFQGELSDLLTPASSIQHSPLTFQGELSDQYLPTPASSTPLSFQDELLDQYLPTPTSSTPLTFQGELLDQYLSTPASLIHSTFQDYLPTSASSNQHLIMSSGDLLPTDTVMYPHLSEITPTAITTAITPTIDRSICGITPESINEFLFNADMLTAYPPSLIPTTTNTEALIDFELYAENDAALTSNTPLTAVTTDMESTMYNPFEYGSYYPFSINSATLFPDQCDHDADNGTSL